VLTNTISASLARSYADRFGITIPQWRVMAVVGAEPGLTAREVADRTRMDKVGVSRAVSKLLDDGRLLRRPDPNDRRRAALRLSARGRRIYDQVVPLARAYEAELLGALSEAERRSLDRLVAHLDEAALTLAARRAPPAAA
jgi:DNA-binding MarR family transcriptional regulator